MRAYLAAAVREAVRPSRRNCVLWSVCGLTLAIQMLTVVLLKDGQIFDWEVDVTRQIQRIPNRMDVFDVFLVLTNTIAWEFVPIFLVVLAAVWLLHQREAAALLLLSFPLHVLAQWPKAVLDRPRPPHGYDVAGAGGLQSFPSGHAEFVITFWGFVVYVALLQASRPAIRRAILAGWLVLVAGTGVGRIAIGRHWPVDVLVSYLVGLGLLSGLIWLHSALLAARRKVQSSPPA